MCDTIVMPDGKIIESINPGDCLCSSSQEEIMIWIVGNVKELEINETLYINRNPFGYLVFIKSGVKG